MLKNKIEKLDINKIMSPMRSFLRYFDGKIYREKESGILVVEGMKQKELSKEEQRNFDYILTDMYENNKDFLEQNSDYLRRLVEQHNEMVDALDTIEQKKAKLDKDYEYQCSRIDYIIPQKDSEIKELTSKLYKLEKDYRLLKNSLESIVIEKAQK